MDATKPSDKTYCHHGHTSRNVPVCACEPRRGSTWVACPGWQLEAGIAALALVGSQLSCRYEEPEVAMIARQEKATPLEATSIRIAIVDDHPTARDRMLEIFARYESIDVVSSVDRIENIGPLLRNVDVVLLDLYLAHGRVEPTAIAEISRTCRVIVISDTVRQADVNLARTAGASGFLAKNLPDESYIEALLVSLKGGFYEPLTRRRIGDFKQTHGPDVSQNPVLAPREHQVLSYLALGLTLKETASHLGISPTTVDTYLKRIRKKLGPGNQATLIRKAVQTAGFNAWQELNTKESAKKIHHRTKASH